MTAAVKVERQLIRTTTHFLRAYNDVSIKNERTNVQELPLSRVSIGKKLTTPNQPDATRGVKAKCSVMSRCFFSVMLKSTAERCVGSPEDRSVYLSIYHAQALGADTWRGLRTSTSVFPRSGVKRTGDIIDYAGQNLAAHVSRPFE